MGKREGRRMAELGRLAGWLGGWLLDLPSVRSGELRRKCRSSPRLLASHLQSAASTM